MSLHGGRVLILGRFCIAPLTLLATIVLTISLVSIAIASDGAVVGPTTDSREIIRDHQILAMKDSDEDVESVTFVTEDDLYEDEGNRIETLGHHIAVSILYNLINNFLLLAYTLLCVCVQM